MSIDTNSKSLREFSLNVKNKRGDMFHIEYGYDLNIKTAGFYVRASINNGPMSSSKKILNRVSNLNINGITQLINLIGSDHTGLPYDAEAEGANILDAHIVKPSDNTTRAIMEYFRAYDNKSIARTEDLIQKYTTAMKNLSTKKTLDGYIKRYIKASRLRYLNEVRSTVQALRDLYMKGCEVNEVAYLPVFRGYLKDNHYPSYYKRDIDYARKARVNIYTNILKKEYVPYSE